MKENGKKELWRAIAFLLAFALWTVLICTVDVRSAGVNGTEIGFASLNVWFHRLTGVNLTLYSVTDWLGLIPIFVCLCFGALGLAQWVRRKRLVRVDPDLLLLGGYYLLVIFAYLFFETAAINYRPVLIDERAEASYPSSTVLLVLSVTPTLCFQVKRRCKNAHLRGVICAFAAGFSVFMTAGRLLSGVHWASDVIGAMFLSAGLFLFYRACVIMRDRKDAKRTEGREDGVS